MVITDTYMPQMMSYITNNSIFEANLSIETALLLIGIAKLTQMAIFSIYCTQKGGKWDLEG